MLVKLPRLFVPLIRCGRQSVRVLRSSWLGRPPTPQLAHAGVAQSVEQGFCKPQVVGSIPSASSNLEREDMKKKKEIEELKDDELTQFRREQWCRAMHGLFEDIYKQACASLGNEKNKKR